MAEDKFHRLASIVESVSIWATRYASRNKGIRSKIIHLLFGTLARPRSARVATNLGHNYLQ